ncbi:hypothetical protein [Bradyrhizobium sp. CCBAU 11430]|uniref:hypothetical protein n=1 Tax=Bradyrhizobium sp. CCBAU 11430 TaxID=1630881 RepID=UPI003FA4ABCC
MLSSVDLPDPDEPMIATISPGRMLSEKSSSATTLVSPAVNSRRTFSIAMIGSAK